MIHQELELGAKIVDKHKNKKNLQIQLLILWIKYTARSN